MQRATNIFALIQHSWVLWPLSRHVTQNEERLRAMPDQALPDIDPRGQAKDFRHSALVRLMHRLNVECSTILLTSGLQILNARPNLY